MKNQQLNPFSKWVPIIKINFPAVLLGRKSAGDEKRKIHYLLFCIDFHFQLFFLNYSFSSPLPWIYINLFNCFIKLLLVFSFCHTKSDFMLLQVWICFSSYFFRLFVTFNYTWALWLCSWDVFLVIFT